MVTADEIFARSPHGVHADARTASRAASAPGRAVRRRRRTRHGRRHRLGHPPLLRRLRPGPAHRRRPGPQLPVRPRGVRPAHRAARGRQRRRSSPSAGSSRCAASAPATASTTRRSSSPTARCPRSAAEAAGRLESARARGHVIAYFADDPTRVYQLVQWLPSSRSCTASTGWASSCATPSPRTLLARPHRPAGLHRPVVPRADRALRRARRQGRALLQQLDAQLPVAARRPAACTCTSTTARATSRAWRATTPRPTTGSSSPARPRCSATRPGCSSSTPAGWCASAGPQLDLRPAPLLAPSPRRTVLYAPTWEGDADYNDYTSVDTLGASIVRAVLAVPDVRLVYKPHPKVVTSRTPAVARGAPATSWRWSMDAAAAEPDAGHDAGHRRRHPGGDARLRRDGHRRVVGGAGLALPAHRQADLHHRPPPRRRGGCAQDVPVSRCADVVDARNVDAG